MFRSFFPSWFYALFPNPLSFIFCAVEYVYDCGTTERTVSHSSGLSVKRVDFQSPSIHQLLIVSQKGGGFMSPSSSTWGSWLTCSSASLEHETLATVSSLVQLSSHIWLIVFPTDILSLCLLQVFLPPLLLWYLNAWVKSMMQCFIYQWALHNSFFAN